MFGFININKPPQWTSRDVVSHVEKMCRRRLRRRVKVGHAGTLDPMATGVLLVCIGPATKLVPWLHELSKSYTATFRFGFRSLTDDTDGEVHAVDNAPVVTEESLRSLLPEFTGHIEQVPPQVSALKIDGKRAYKMAKQGVTVDLAPRPVEIHRMELSSFAYPEFSLDVDCGSGTYIRALGRDLAARLGTCAVMSELVRTAIGPFHLQNAVPLGELSAENLGDYLQSPLAGLGHLPTLQVDEEIAAKLDCGCRLPLKTVGARPHQKCVAVTCGERLVCLAKCRQHDLKPDLVFSSRELD